MSREKLFIMIFTSSLVSIGFYFFASINIPIDNYKKLIPISILIFFCTIDFIEYMISGKVVNRIYLKGDIEVGLWGLITAIISLIIILGSYIFVIIQIQ